MCVIFHRGVYKVTVVDMGFVFSLLFLLLVQSSVSMAAEPPPAGVVINHENLVEYQNYLDDTLTDLIANKQLTLEVTESEPFPVHPEYAKLTEQYTGTVSLGDQPGVLNHYVSGRPFPGLPALDDTRAGEKIAWNMRYSFSGDSGKINPFYWQYRNMRTSKVERELSFVASNLRFKHRTVIEPIPAIKQNTSDIFNALYLRVIKPADIRNTQLLIHRLDDDTKQEQGWLYLGTQRRVRRLPTGQNTDAFLGSDVMIEDFLGYNGRIMDMDWHFIETRDVLLPFFRHSELALSEREEKGFRFVNFSGAGNCFPHVKWQLRKAHIIEAKPKRTEHPLSKRLYYVDAETYIPAYGRLYDRAGKLWKFALAAFSHPDHHLPVNKGSYVPILDAVSMIDLQAQHCTTMQVRAEVNVSELQASDFMVQELRRKGR